MRSFLQWAAVGVGAAVAAIVLCGGGRLEERRPGVDPKTGRHYVLDPVTGTVVKDPSHGEFKWVPPWLNPTIRKARGEVERLASLPRPRNSRDLIDQAFERPVFDRKDAVQLLMQLRYVPGPLWEKRGAETREFFLFSGRGRYEYGEFRWGVAIRKRDGRIVRWDLRDEEERQADLRDWKNGGSRAVRAKRGEK